jgi:hypothetical protein
MEAQMAAQSGGNQPGKQSIELELTEQQKQMLVKAFGEDLVKRMRGIKVEQIAGYLKAELNAN